MVEYKCKKCNKVFNHLGNYNTHIMRVFPCDEKKEEKKEKKKKMQPGLGFRLGNLWGLAGVRMPPAEVLLRNPTPTEVRALERARARERWGENMSLLYVSVVCLC